MDTPLVTLPNGKIKTVKNLGWLARRLLLVQRIEVNSMVEPAKYGECVILAYLQDGRKYRCCFASKQVCWEWLHRTNLYGVLLVWCGEPMLIRPGNKHKYPWAELLTA